MRCARFLHQNTEITIEPLVDGRRRISVRALDGGHVERASIDTSYPDDLIERLLRLKGAAYLCDEIARDEDRSQVQGYLSSHLQSFGVSRSRLERARILDYGCGCGASTVALARMFPEATIVGVELDPGFVEAARALVAFHGHPRVTIHASPSGVALPEGLGEFDAIVMGGVFEHLLPDERRELMPKLWRTLGRGGFLLLYETPHRGWFIETHTTGLPLLNYLPDDWAHLAARLSPRYDRPQSWATLLRHGVRGGSEPEVLACLDDPSARSVSPLAGDLIDLWYVHTTPRARLLKKLVWAGLKGIKVATGVTRVPFLSMMIEQGVRSGSSEPARPDPG